MHTKRIKCSIKQVEIKHTANTDNIVDHVLWKKEKKIYCMAVIANNAKHYKQAIYMLY